MEPLQTGSEVKFRALLTNAKEFQEKGPDTEMRTTRWYDEEPPLKEVMGVAKEKGYDLVIIEEMKLTMRTFKVDEN